MGHLGQGKHSTETSLSSNENFTPRGKETNKVFVRIRQPDLTSELPLDPTSHAKPMARKGPLALDLNAFSRRVVTWYFFFLSLI